MLPETHPLIESATKPLADNAEQRLAAVALLEETFDEEHPDVPIVKERFKKIDEKKQPGYWRWLVYSLAAVMVAVLVVAGFPKVMSFELLRSAFDPLGFPRPANTVSLEREDLSSKEKLLLGDLNKTPFERAEELWESEPGRPDFYAEYVGEFIREFGRLPEDYLSTSEEIDPENSFFLYLAVGFAASENIEREMRTREDREKGKRTEYTVLDADGLSEAYGLIRKARSKPRFRTYAPEMIAARIPLLKRDEFLQSLLAPPYLTHTVGIIQLRHLGDLVSAEMNRLADEGDDDELRELIKDNEHFLRVWTESPTSGLVEYLILRVCASSTSDAARAATKRLGLEAQFPQFEDRFKNFEAIYERKYTRDYPFLEAFERRGGTYAATVFPMLARQATDPVPIDEDELMPGRLVDHEFVSQLCVLTVSVLLSISWFAVLLFRFRSPFHVRKLSGRLSRLFTPVDWIWILLLGVAFPFVLILVVNRFTIFGGRGYSLHFLTYVLPVAHYLLMGLLFVYAPVLVIRWRMKSRFAVFALNSRFYVLGWVSVGVSLAFLPVFYYFAVIKRPQDEVRVLLTTFLLLPLALSIVISMGRALFGKGDRRLTRAMAANALLPAYALGIILLVSLYPWFHASERHWFQQDGLMRPDPDYPAWTPFEYRVSSS